MANRAPHFSELELDRRVNSRPTGTSKPHTRPHKSWPNIWMADISGKFALYAGSSNTQIQYARVEFQWTDVDMFEGKHPWKQIVTRKSCVFGLRRWGVLRGIVDFWCPLFWLIDPGDVAGCRKVQILGEVGAQIAILTSDEGFKQTHDTLCTPYTTVDPLQWKSSINIPSGSGRWYLQRWPGEEDLPGFLRPGIPRSWTPKVRSHP